MDIEPENWPAILVFCACDTQWRHHNNGRPIGLDYQSLESVMRMQGVENVADVFARVRILERESLRVMRGE